LNHPTRLSGKPANQANLENKDKQSDALFAELVDAVVSAMVREKRMLASETTFLSLEPRGLNRARAAAYVGVSPSLFDEMISDGRMPRPKRINSRVVWDRKRLDEAFEALPSEDEPNPWDKAQEAA
jgi:predicted DNA-binding transcriptional regulator AlpA